MKLSSDQVQLVERQIDGKVIPNNHPLSPQLQRAFGDHTFFVNRAGLTIVKPSPADSQAGTVVKLAGWADEAHTTLEPDVPESMSVVVKLET
jgi:hypothetical protein